MKMNFQTFWNTVKSNSHDFVLKTLDRGLEFQISPNSNYPLIPNNDVLYVTPKSTGKERPIQKSQFMKVWEYSKSITKPYIPSNYTLITHNSSYIVSLMKHVLGEQKIE